MFKRWASFILILVMVFSLSTVFADANLGPEVWNITVTEQGGNYKLGNVELQFPKNFMGKDMEPITFIVSQYIEDDVPYIDIEPSVEKFDKPITIKVKKGTVEMYDTSTDRTIKVRLENYCFRVKHFSRYIIQP
jgi:hypothetical protein